MKHICILGSINMDEVMRVDRLVKSGETIFAKEYNKYPGGKGANQAVAAKRLGANVYMIGKIGIDSNGSNLLKSLQDDKVNTEYVYKDIANPTGMAIISVDDEGNNSIIVIPGANMAINKKEIQDATELIKQSKVVVAQFETPVEMTIAAFKIARENGVMTLLNPAPAKEIPDELLKLTDIIVPNETEAYELTKINTNSDEGIKNASQKFIEKGVTFVIITLGERGAAIVTKDKFDIVPAYKVNAIDTTAAGDSFIGGLCSVFEKEDDISYEVIKKAIKFGNKVSGIVVQRRGAQTSIPHLNEVLDAYKED